MEDKFTWIKTFNELANNLRGFKNKQGDLINILREFEEAGLPTISITDKLENGDRVPLTSIDNISSRL